MKPETIDYSHVPARHCHIHEKLEQWARWVRVNRAAWQTHPMWREYRSNAWQWERPEVKNPLNTIEALQMEKAVACLPILERSAVRWCYVHANSPVKMARELKVTKQELANLVDGGRDMLVNRMA